MDELGVVDKAHPSAQAQRINNLRIQLEKTNKKMKEKYDAKRSY